MTDAADRDHVQRLIAAWGIVADFCFGDLLLFVPDDGMLRPASFTVTAQIRPTTNQTLYQDDLVGVSFASELRPAVSDAWATGRACDANGFALPSAGVGPVPARIVAIPVHRRLGDGSLRKVAVLTRESALDAGRRPGRLERAYLEVFDRLATMLREGTYPFAHEAEEDADAPRVGDGVITLDAKRAVAYASPNAMSALHRLGLRGNVEGRSLEELALGAGAVEAVFSTRSPASIEIDRLPGDASTKVIVVLRAIPLLDGGEDDVVGAVVLVRDVSDLRRRDRLLLTKDVSIREVHHRVKNNLQTISALLRLQGRRLASPEAKLAIEESVRRIRSIALVHETLARDARDAVPFDEVVRPLVRIVEEGLASPERPLRISVSGALGDLPPETATPLVMVLTELLQNAVEHAFPSGTSERNPGRIDVTLASDAGGLSIEVRDNGVGLPVDFSPSTSSSLGLSIVRTLVTTELGGAIAFRNDGGAVVDLRVPRVSDPRLR